MIQTLKYIEPLQAGKIAGAIYGLMALVFVPFFLVFAIIGMLVPQAASSQAGMSSMVGGVIFLVFAVAMPIFYAVFGFLFGVIGAWIYNVVAKWIGGLRYEVE